MVKPVEQNVVVERASLPKEKSFVDHQYGIPKKATFEDELELRSLTSLKGTKPKPPQTRENVKGHIEAMMREKGLKGADKLPPAYQEALKRSVQTARNFGLSEIELDGLRFSVTQLLLAKKLD